MKTFFAVLLALTGPLISCYHPPQEGVQLFRRDTLALDANRQLLLAKDLVKLAIRPDALEDPSQRRATAQLLALAANFDPSSKAPANINKSFVNENESEIFSNTSWEETLAALSPTVLFLLEDKTNPAHRKIAQLLLDPIAVAAPDSDLASLSRPKESPLWQRAIAPPERFQKKTPEEPTAEPTDPKPEENLLMAETDTEDDGSEEKEPSAAIAIPASFQGRVLAPLTLRERPKEGQNQRSAPLFSQVGTLQMRAEVRKNDGQVRTPFQDDSTLRRSIHESVKKLLLQSHSEEILKRTSALFTISEGNFHSSSGRILALPMALLWEAFLSEREPIPDLILFGDFEEDGSIVAPENPWHFLEILTKLDPEKSHRILIAPDLRPQFEALLTMQEEDFFLQFQVFETATFEDVCELAFIESSPETTQTALEKFSEIQRVADGKTTSVFVANPHVLKRLTEVCQLEKRFLSPALLEMRGKSAHPSKHSTPVLAALIQTAIEPTQKAPYSRDSRNLTPEYFQAIHDQCRASLDPHVKDVAIGDRELFEEALSLANLFRTLARAKQRYDKEESKHEENFNVTHYFDTMKTLRSEYYLLASKLAKILGTTPPTDPTPAPNEKREEEND